MRQHTKNQHLKVCADCGILKRHQGRGLCGGCYSKRKKTGTLPPLLRSYPQESARLTKIWEEEFLRANFDRYPAPPSIIPAEAEIYTMPEGENAEIEGENAVLEIKNPSILLVFLPDDIPLYESVMAEAKFYRRDPDQHILWRMQREVYREAELMKEVENR